MNNPNLVKIIQSKDNLCNIELGSFFAKPPPTCAQVVAQVTSTSQVEYQIKVRLVLECIMGVAWMRKKKSTSFYFLNDRINEYI